MRFTRGGGLYGDLKVVGRSESESCPSDWGSVGDYNLRMLCLGDDNPWLLCARRCEDTDGFESVGIECLVIGLAKMFEQLVAGWVLRAAVFA